MGLDMYLTKRTYIGANYEHNKVKGNIKLTKEDKPIKVNLKRVTYIDENVGYWRKDNQIHAWFVNNCGDGEDNCQDIDVSKEKLTELLSLCKQVKEDHSKAEDLLPTQEGFFFGTYQYDDWYFNGIQNTIDIVEPLLKELSDEDYCEIVYRASW